MSNAAISSSTVPDNRLSLKLLFALATGAGVSVASIYYSQPVIGLLASDMSVGVSQAGLIPTLTQLGYAIGLFFLVPMGDSLNRKSLVLLKLALLALSLFVCSVAPNYVTLLGTSLLIGMMATTAQDIVPAVAALSDTENRGKSVGTVMTGLLLGILLSRVFSGVVAKFAGWQSVYIAAAIVVIVLIAWLWRVLPNMPASSRLSYRQVMGSLFPLWRQYPALRSAAFAQSMISLAFSAFWTTLALYLSDVYHLDSAVAGAFGLAGAAGALAAPLSGRLSDKVGPRVVTVLSVLLVLVSFVLMAGVVWLPASLHLPVLIVLTISFDFGLSAAMIAHQSIVYSLQPEARGRLNAIFFTFAFIGMAAGSALGSHLYALFGWEGVVILAVSTSTLALIVRFRCWWKPIPVLSDSLVQK